MEAGLHQPSTSGNFKMSGKGGKRISVFDRLGPGNDEDGHTSSTHRRVSTDKPSEKRHSASERTRHCHTDEGFSEEDVGKAKPPSKKRLQEAPPKELFSKPPEKMKTSVRGDQLSSESGSAEPEEAQKKRTRVSVPDDRKEERKEDRKDPKVTEKKEKSDRHIVAVGSSESTLIPHTRVSSESTSHSRPEDSHKRHSRDDEPSSESARHDRKRRRESSDDEKVDGLESKRARTIEDSSKKKSRDVAEEGEDSSKTSKKYNTEGEEGVKKRKKEEEAKAVAPELHRQSNSFEERRATTKDSEVISSDRRRGQEFGSGRRTRDKERKGDGVATASSDSEGEGVENQKTEWSSLPSLLLEFPLSKPLLPLERFSPAAILMNSGVSSYLAGPELYQKAISVVSSHLRNQHPTLPLSVVNEPFGGLPSFGSAGAAYLESQLELTNMYVECGTRRGCRALTTSMDCAVRGKLKKCSSKVLLPSQAPTSWDASGHYKSSIGFYHAADSISSVSKLKESVVGSVLVV
eukprot:Em0021g885a